MEIKVCGMREPGNIQALISEVKPDWMGLIFYAKSPRLVLDDSANDLALVPIKKVGVFVNASEQEILDKISRFQLSAVQLHGAESPSYLKSLFQQTEVEIWKVFSVDGLPEWEKMEPYLPFTSKFLFDTASPSHGGTGQRFDWNILKTYPFEKSFFLSGGLDEDSADEILELAKELPFLSGVDLNSRFEDVPALKNIERLIRFKNRILGCSQ
jgi:phosphoribosylanthranilate isomerase